jgi:hypothetical protein
VPHVTASEKLVQPCVQWCVRTSVRIAHVCTRKAIVQCVCKYAYTRVPEMCAEGGGCDGRCELAMAVCR